MGVLFYVLTWTALSLPIGVFFGRIFAEMDRTPSQRHRNNLNRGTMRGCKHLQSVREGEFLMTEDQIAALDDHELAMRISRVQHLVHADRELSELLDERRRRQIVAAIDDTADDELLHLC